MTESAASYLNIYLGPLQAQLARADVTDIYVNRPGEVWVETLGGAVERHDIPELTEANVWRLARQVASVTHQGISREHPLLAARLPDGSRVQIVAPPATRGAMAIAIRKHVSANLELADYVAQGAFEHTVSGTAEDPIAIDLARLHAGGDWAGFLRLAVRARKTILVSGGTSTGKTTFLNALLKEIPSAERLILIEDTPELQVGHRNHAGLVAVRGALGEASVGVDDLLIASLRMRPDRIIIGELRGREAFTFLRAVNTGHPGSISTVHADTPAGAIDQLVLMTLQQNQSLRRTDVYNYARTVIDVVVQLQRRAGRRGVAELHWLRRNTAYKK